MKKSAVLLVLIFSVAFLFASHRTFDSQSEKSKTESIDNTETEGTVRSQPGQGGPPLKGIIEEITPDGAVTLQTDEGYKTGDWVDNKVKPEIGMIAYFYPDEEGDDEPEGPGDPLRDEPLSKY